MPLKHALFLRDAVMLTLSFCPPNGHLKQFTCAYKVSKKAVS